ncbi:superoxide dismutase family protein [Halobacillus amylolyticus]|uniref:Superoxide dismutase [Cu-Zn] n=2 Tax=Halobacillus amylolyticus TaxID=2932259 RepID=A0ABY4HGQ2_9BACI|nr:superoxide dismutase family protein [Halobacillus amylolyticus]
MKFVLIGVLTTLLTITGCGEKRSPLESALYNQAGDRIGTVTLTEQPGGVEVKVKAEGLEAGPHGIHIHEFPKCEGPDFKSAGNHFNPTQKKHGLMNQKGAHVGDLPNIDAESSGMADAKLMLPEATLKDGQTSLLRKEGTSVVIHSGPDDGMSQPAGDSGDRVACAEITLNSEKAKASDPTELNKKQEK